MTQEVKEKTLAVVEETAFVEATFAEGTAAKCVLVVEQQSGFASATQLPQPEGKSLNQYLGSEHSEDLKRILICNKKRYEETIVNDNAHLAGTYYHPALLLDLAAWLAPETYVGAAVIIDAFFNRNDLRKAQLRTLLVGQEDIVYRPEAPYRRITCGSLQLLANEDGWFNAAHFCHQFKKRMAHFEETEHCATLLKYCPAKVLDQGKYYHPLLFLRLAAWVDAKLYLKSVYFVFCCMDEELKALFRREIAAAGAALIGRPAQMVELQQQN